MSDSTPPPVNNPPLLHFTLPVDTMHFFAPADLGVLVEASDSDGTIDHVVMYLDGNLIRRENAAPYTWGTTAPVTDSALLGMPAGTYTLRAEATDNDGATASVSMTVLVEAGAVKAITGGNHVPAVMSRPAGTDRLYDLTGKLVPAERARRINAPGHATSSGLSGVFVRSVNGSDACFKFATEILIR